jgi:hypothetical protein
MLHPARSVDRADEQVYMHKPSRRRKARSIAIANPSVAIANPSVPLELKALKEQEYILTTEGVVTQTGNGHHEFNAMPDWLQEAAYAKWKCRFNLFLWGKLNSFRAAVRRQKYLRTRKIIGDRCLLFRPSFKKCICSMQNIAADIADPPPCRLMQTRRQARYNPPEARKHLSEQRVSAHEAFVESMDRVIRLVEGVISEIKVQEMRDKATAIQQAKKDEIHRWKKYPKDAAKINAAPNYGPNNRLNPQSAQLTPLHMPLKSEADIDLLGPFIRLCDFYTLYSAMFQLENHIKCFLQMMAIGATQKGADRLEYLHTHPTFNVPAEIVERAQAAKAIAALGGGVSPEADAEETWAPIYFEPTVDHYKEVIATGFKDLAIVLETPRLLFYEPFKQHLKGIISFQEMQQVQNVHEILPRDFLEVKISAAYTVLEDSYETAQKNCIEIFDSMDEFYLFATRKVEQMRACTAPEDLAHVPSTLRMCHTWHKRILDLQNRPRGTDTSPGVLWAEGACMQQELTVLVESVFHEAQRALEAVIDSNAMAIATRAGAFRDGLEQARDDLLQLRVAPRTDECPGSASSAEGSALDIEKMTQQAEQKMVAMLRDGWDVLGTGKAEADALDALVSWLLKPAQWLPGQITEMQKPQVKQKADGWGGSIDTLMVGKVHAVKNTHAEADFEEADEQTTYKVVVFTGERPGAGTEAVATIELVGYKKTSGPMQLNANEAGFDQGRPSLQTGSKTSFELGPMVRVRKIKQIKLSQDGGGEPGQSSWYVDAVEITDTASGEHFSCPVSRWLDDNAVEKLSAIRTDGGSFAAKSPVHTRDGFELMQGAFGLGAMSVTDGKKVEPDSKIKALLRKKAWAGPPVARKKIRELESALCEIAEDVQPDVVQSEL